MVNKKNKRGPKPLDIKGLRFGRLIAFEYADNGKWHCSCDCGCNSIAHGSDLRRGRVKSCGCLLLEGNRANLKHGYSATSEYRSWVSMLRRCSDPGCMGYHRYGGRGVKVCERWQKFENFYADMGDRPSGTSLDRIDFDGNYEPSNCRWATRLEQSTNTSRTIIIVANGKQQSLCAWARELGVSAKGIRYRLKRGMSHEDAINKPFRKHQVW